MRDDTFMTLMRLLPKAALSAAVGKATRVPAPAALHRAAIRAFAGRYGVALEEAERDVESYRTFSEFFSRRLREGLRPVDPDARAVVSPVDGAISQIGTLAGQTCLQAKGISFPVSKLLGSEEEAQGFAGGAFATLYLSPKDYHRIHAPLSGDILGYAYLPGQFWPVNPSSVRTKEALFCLNERLVTYLRTPAGICAVVKVGATCVARIRAAYDDVLTHAGRAAHAERYAQPRPVKKGDELGSFEMGSTVILLFEKGRVAWEPSLAAGDAVRMGRRMGTLA
jgi:phosphatidylserine decarboxylase